VSDCRFDRRWYDHGDGSPCPMPPLSPTGAAFGYVYPCRRDQGGRCEAWHWCVPAAEADGTEATAQAAHDAGLQAMDRAGLTPDHGEHSPCWCCWDIRVAGVVR
jgi:hypothetical protein